MNIKIQESKDRYMSKKVLEWAFGNLKKEEANVVSFGIPLGRDSEKMLSSLREVSNFVDVFDTEREINLLENVRLADVGDINIRKLEDITKKTKEILDENKFPLVFSKSHLATYYTIQAFPKNTKIVLFDAHGDIKDEYADEKSDESVEPLKLNKEFSKRYNYTTWVRRFCEDKSPSNIAIVGVRSCDEFDFEYMSKNVLYFTPAQVRNDIEVVKEKLRKFVKDSNVYISVDIDVFDPAIAPAVDNPEHNGIFLPEFLQILDEVCKSNIVGMDLVEIKPLGENKITEYLAVWVIFQILSRVIK